LQALHAASPSVLHLDLKPVNILVSKDGQPKIADFGLCLHVKRGVLAEGRRGSSVYMVLHSTSPK